jgi:predicted RNase H-like HicB family nuclease
MFDVWYWAVLERNKEGRYFAHVPDLPGATASGATEREVLQNIAEIAADHVRDLVEDGHEVPAARSNDEIERDPDVHEVGRVAIPVDVPGKSVKISLSIDEALLKRIDRAANKAGMTRSGFLAAAAEARIAATERPDVVRRSDVVRHGLDVVGKSMGHTVFIESKGSRSIGDWIGGHGAGGGNLVIRGKDLVRLGREISALEQAGFIIPGLTDDDEVPQSEER